MYFNFILVVLVFPQFLSLEAYAQSNAAKFLAREEIAAACDNASGRISRDGVIERDLTGDGHKDLILLHDAIVCDREFARSIHCGTQTCLTKIFVRQGRLLRLIGELQATNVQVSRDQIPTISARRHGGRKLTIRWDGTTFSDPSAKPPRSAQLSNNTSASVSKIQKSLNTLGYDAGTVDGIAGPGTRAAIRSFQRDNGLNVSGQLTNEGKKKLAELSDNFTPTREKPKTSDKLASACIGEEWCGNPASKRPANSDAVIRGRMVRATGIPGLKRYIESRYNDTSLDPTTLNALLVDLDETKDGVEEIILEVAGAGYCGSSGCRYQVLRRLPDGRFRSLLSGTLAHGISLTSGYTNGLLSIVVGRRIKKGKRWGISGSVFFFDGKKYVHSTQYYQNLNRIESASGSEKPEKNSSANEDRPVVAKKSEERSKAIEHNLDSEDSVEKQKTPTKPWSKNKLVDEFEYQIARANYIRKKIVRDPEILFEKLKNNVDPQLLQTLNKSEGVRDVLVSSIPMTGCAGDQLAVFGFYNVVLNVWIFFWVDKNEAIKEIRLSAGFVPKNQSLDSIAWPNFVTRDVTFLSAMTQSLKLQQDIFAFMFPYQNCPKMDELDFAFTDDQAAYFMLENRYANQKTDKNFLDEILMKTKLKHKLASLNDIILVSTIYYKEEDITLLFFSLRRDNSVIAVQIWQEEDGRAKLVDEGFGSVMSDAR